MFAVVVLPAINPDRSVKGKPHRRYQPDWRFLHAVVTGAPLLRQLVEILAMGDELPEIWCGQIRMAPGHTVTEG